MTIGPKLYSGALCAQNRQLANIQETHQKSQVLYTHLVSFSYDGIWRCLPRFGRSSAPLDITVAIKCDL